MNKKQTGGQDLCKCGHKEFHHVRCYEGNYICAMSGCLCENYKPKEKK
jgi:hypothetical protein